MSIGSPSDRLHQERGLTLDPLAAKLALSGLENAGRAWVAKIESRIRSAFELAVLAKVSGVGPEELLPIGEIRLNLEARQRGGRS